MSINLWLVQKHKENPAIGHKMNACGNLCNKPDPERQVSNCLSFVAIKLQSI